MGQMLDQLRKHGTTSVHPTLLLFRPPPPSAVSALADFKSFPAATTPIPLTTSRLHQLHAIYPGQQ